MQRNEERNCVEVKATVTEILDSKTGFIYDGGFHREYERQSWMERQEMRRDFLRCGPGRYTFLDRDDVDDVLPRRACYAETTTKVRARYAVDGQVYEREVVLSDADSQRLAGKKIYLTLDPARPEEPLLASQYKSKGVDYTLLACGAAMIIMIFCFAFSLQSLHLV